MITTGVTVTTRKEWRLHSGVRVTGLKGSPDSFYGTMADLTELADVVSDAWLADNPGRHPADASRFIGLEAGNGIITLGYEVRS